ncbi:hypothetical protein [Nonomuraea sp. NPDC049309]|uniref:hypothetical protein n=1 Tax=Nonomuraea sp. NPDC049309 TaxID=3364350 RepID=UPI003719B63C
MAVQNAGAPPMSNVTRYLCAAAYLDSEFRFRVLDELFSDPYRAVPPSYGGFDLMPVIHHCRRSQQLLLIRDALITALLVIGVIVSPLTTLQWVATLIPFAMLTSRRVRRGPLILRLLLWIWACHMVVLLLATFLALYHFTRLAATYGVPISELSGLPEFLGGVTFTQALFFPVAMLGVAVIYRVAVYLTLAGRLRPGTPEPAGRAADPRIARRLDYIARAQWGNITMYGNENAFLGAGNIERTWSIAVELDRVRDGAGSRRQHTPVDIDPVDLHAFVRRRMAEMRDHVLRPNEGIQRLDIGDHVVMRGLFTVADWTGRRLPGAHPFIGKDGLPRYQATPEEIAAITRHPQGGVRYYQRVTIGNAGQEIRDAKGELVAPAAEQEALTSAFIYLAVEGRMLYTQFVVTVLPPVLDPYHVVDRLPSMNPGRIAWEAVRVLRLRLLRDVFAAPVRVVRTAVQAIRLGRTVRDPREHIVYPYGALRSVRELGADTDMQTYIQTLDVAKYVKMIEHRLTEAVLDYLEEHQVDTGAYRLQAAGVTMNATVTVGPGATVSGPMAFGPYSSATLHGTAGATS